MRSVPLLPARNGLVTGQQRLNLWRNRFVVREMAAL